ncbi:EamA family transporter [Leucobacter chromiireducens]|uniref:EamA family transporter n=1 Tax=Leucobacter chromiireducens TaxID=283877 RepID=UPI003F80C7FC
MSPTALLLVLTAAVCHAAWNIIAHRASGSGMPFLWWGSLVSALIWVWVIPFTGGIGDATLGGVLLGVLVSGVLHVVYMVVLQRGYARGDLSTVYATARGTGPLLTVLIAVLFLGERPGGWALGGVALIILGVVAFGLVGRQGRRQPGLDPALVYGLLTGVAIASYTVWDAYTVTELGVAPVAFMVGCALAEVPFFTLALLRRGGARTAAARLAAEWRGSWKRLLAFGVLSPLSYVLVLTAITLAPVALVAPMREVSVVLVGLYGAWRFRESRPVLRIAAALVVVVGVTLIGG